MSYSESFLPRSGEQFKEMDALEALEDPDEFENTEIGYKYDGENATFSIACSSLNRRASTRPISMPSKRKRDLEVDGIEIAYAGKINDKLTLSATFSDLDGENSGKKAREIPEQTYTIWAAYQASEKLNLGLGLTYQGESHISDGSAAKLPDYERVDFSLNYDLRDDMVLRSCRNLTDEVYFPHARSTHQVSVGEPLNAGGLQKF